MRKRANPDSEPNIRRIDSKARAEKQTHGFQVHFLRGREVVTKMFSDTIFGGKESARRAARKFKKAAMLELPERIFRGPNSAKKSSGGAKKSKSVAVKAKAKSPARKKPAAKSTAKTKAPVARAKSKKKTTKRR